MGELRDGPVRGSKSPENRRPNPHDREAGTPTSGLMAAAVLGPRLPSESSLTSNTGSPNAKEHLLGGKQQRDWRDAVDWHLTVEERAHPIIGGGGDQKLEFRCCACGPFFPRPRIDGRPIYRCASLRTGRDRRNRTLMRQRLTGAKSGDRGQGTSGLRYE